MVLLFDKMPFLLLGSSSVRFGSFKKPDISNIQSQCHQRWWLRRIHGMAVKRSASSEIMTTLTAIFMCFATIDRLVGFNQLRQTLHEKFIVLFWTFKSIFQCCFVQKEDQVENIITRLEISEKLRICLVMSILMDWSPNCSRVLEEAWLHFLSLSKSSNEFLLILHSWY